MNKKLIEIIAEIIEVLDDVVYEQATREISGHDWGKEKLENLERLRKELKSVGKV